MNMNVRTGSAVVLASAVAAIGHANTAHAVEQDPNTQPAVAAQIGAALLPKHIQPFAAGLDQADRLACAADAAAMYTDQTITVPGGRKVGMASNIVRIDGPGRKKINALQFSVDPTPLDEVFDDTGNTMCKDADVDQEVDVTFTQGGKRVAALNNVVKHNNGDGKKETANARLRRALRVGKALVTEVRTTGHVAGTNQTVSSTQRYSFVVTKK